MNKKFLFIIILSLVCSIYAAQKGIISRIENDQRIHYEVTYSDGASIDAIFFTQSGKYCASRYKPGSLLGNCFDNVEVEGIETDKAKAIFDDLNRLWLEQEKSKGNK